MVHVSTPPCFLLECNEYLERYNTMTKRCKPLGGSRNVYLNANISSQSWYVHAWSALPGRILITHQVCSDLVWRALCRVCPSDSCSFAWSPWLRRARSSKRALEFKNCLSLNSAWAQEPVCHERWTGEMIDHQRHLLIRPVSGCLYDRLRV